MLDRWRKQSDIPQNIAVFTLEPSYNDKWNFNRWISLCCWLMTCRKKKEKRKKEKKNPCTIAKVFCSFKTTSLVPFTGIALKNTTFFFFFFSCNISLALFFNRTMNFMGLSTGLTAYEELPRNTRRLFCSLPHVSERSQNNNRVIKMTFTHSLIIIYLFFRSVLSWELFISCPIRLLKPGSKLHYSSLISRRKAGCSKSILLIYL